jgi:hypothetical protein
MSPLSAERLRPQAFPRLIIPDTSAKVDYGAIEAKNELRTHPCGAFNMPARHTRSTRA